MIESSNLNPIIMILSTGANALEDFNSLCSIYEITRGQVHNISLGHGQGEKAI